MKLFCFPHAGGSSSIYLKWNNVIENTSKLEIIPLEYKGHGYRMDEDFYNDFDEMVGDMLKSVLDKLVLGDPFMIFGHSMGRMLPLRSQISLKKNRFMQSIFSYQAGQHLVIGQETKRRYQICQMMNL